MSNNKKEIFLHYLLIIGVSFLFAFLTILISSTVTSFLYPRASNNTYYHDGTMFYILGSNMAKGYTPYIDIYDHKGLYIFYYTAIGALMGRFGVFLIQVILLTITNVFLYKAMEMHVNKLLLILSPIILFSGLYAINAQQPYDSDLEMPFNAIMMYFYLKGIKEDNDKDFLIGNIFLGISAGIAINLRMIDAILPLAFVIYFGVRYIMKKDIKNILINASVVLGAMIVMTVIPLIHASAGGFLEDMIKAVYINNFKYIELAKPELLTNKIIIWVYVLLLGGVFALLLVRKRKEFSKDQIMFIAITFLLTGIFEMVIARYSHYIVLLQPYYALMLIYLLLPYLNNEKHPVMFERITFITSSVIMLATFAINPVMYIKFYDTDEIDISYVNDTIDEESKDGHTLVFGVPGLYLTTNISIGYGDFAAQVNHIDMSDRFTKEALMNYLESADSHYVITGEYDLSFIQGVFRELTTSYKIINRPVGASIYIYEHI